MPWWSWFLIWGVLVAALLAMLAFALWRLIHKFSVAMNALGELADRTELLHSRLADTEPDTWHPAVLDRAGFWRHAFDLKRRSRELHRLRRAELLVQRGKLLITDDPRRSSHFRRRV